MKHFDKMNDDEKNEYVLNKHQRLFEAIKTFSTEIKNHIENISFSRDYKSSLLNDINAMIASLTENKNPENIFVSDKKDYIYDFNNRVMKYLYQTIDLKDIPLTRQYVLEHLNFLQYHIHSKDFIEKHVFQPNKTNYENYGFDQFFDKK